MSDARKGDGLPPRNGERCACGAVDLSPADCCRCTLIHDPKPFYALQHPPDGCPVHGAEVHYGRPEDEPAP